MDDLQTASKRVGFVALIGRPSTGKSTLMNAIIGYQAAIVASLPQSTRQRIRGIYNDDDAQIIFTDTPGMHSSQRRFNQHLLNQAKLGIEEADVVLYLVDATRQVGEEEYAIASLLKEINKPLLIAINKVDKSKNISLDYLIFLNKVLPFASIVKISAKNEEGIAPLIELLKEKLPSGPLLYPNDIYTDQEPSLRISEIIRKHAMRCVKEEIPHALYIHVEDLEMKGSRLWVRIALVVERESQKPILIGKAGANIQKIRTASMKELSSVFPYKIDLNLQVKVDKDWRNNELRLKEILQ